MKILQTVLLGVVTLVAAACAGRSGAPRLTPESVASTPHTTDRLADLSGRWRPLSGAGPAMRSVAQIPAADSTGPAGQDAFSVSPDSCPSLHASSRLGEPRTGSAEADALSGEELAAAALYSETVIRDPWERYNRRVHRINTVIDRWMLRPFAIAYTKGIPHSVRSGVSRFFGNLGMPATAVNQLLQGRPLHAWHSMGRFAVNTTIGIGGVLDPASRMGIRPRGDEDFGQTLAIWGWRDSRYLVMPLFGPRTVRDSTAMLADRQLSPIGYVNDRRTAAALQMLDIVDGRSQLLPLDEARREAYDEYTLVRDAWAQRRQHQIEQGPLGSD